MLSSILGVLNGGCNFASAAFIAKEIGSTLRFIAQTLYDCLFLISGLVTLLVIVFFFQRPTCHSIECICTEVANTMLQYFPVPIVSILILNFRSTMNDELVKKGAIYRHLLTLFFLLSFAITFMLFSIEATRSGLISLIATITIGSILFYLFEAGPAKRNSGPTSFSLPTTGKTMYMTKVLSVLVMIGALWLHYKFHPTIVLLKWLYHYYQHTAQSIWVAQIAVSQLVVMLFSLPYHNAQIIVEGFKLMKVQFFNSRTLLYLSLILIPYTQPFLAVQREWMSPSGFLYLDCISIASFGSFIVPYYYTSFTLVHSYSP